jgi:hypothetical protein
VENGFLEAEMKKLLVLVLFFAVLTVLAFAHGNREKYPLRGYETCHAQNMHLHNNLYFMPHYFNDGHSYHRLCEKNGCNQVSIHQHNGRHYFSGNRR